MKKILILMFGMAMALMLSVSTASAWYISLEPLGCIQVDDGDTFYADVFFNPDEGGNLLGDYAFSVGFDHTELSWVEETTAEQHTPPDPLMKMMGESYLREPGWISNYFAAVMVGGAWLEDKTRLAHIEFIAHPDMYCDGELDVWMRADLDPGGFRVDDVTVFWGDYTFVQGPDVSAVPIPGAALLLGSGLLGLIGIRRKNRS